MQLIHLAAQISQFFDSLILQSIHKQHHPTYITLIIFCIFISPCLQDLLITFLVGSWYLCLCLLVPYILRPPFLLDI